MEKLLKIVAVGALLFSTLSSSVFAAESAWVSSLVNFDGGAGTGDGTLTGLSTSNYQTFNNWTYEAGSTTIALSTAITRDGAKVYLAGDLNGSSEEIKVIDTVTGVTTSLAMPNNNKPATMALNQNETRLYITTFGNELHVVDTDSLTVVETIDSTVNPAFNDTRWVGVAPNGDVWVLAINSGNEGLFKINPGTNAIIGGPFQMPSNRTTGDYIAGAIAFSKDGSKIYLNCRIDTDDNVNPAVLEDSLCIYDIAANNYSHVGDQVISGSTGMDPLEDMAVSADGTRLYKSSFYNNSVSVFDLETDSLIARQAVGDSPAGVDITADGSKVLVVNSKLNEAQSSNDLTIKSTVSVLDTSNNTIIHTAELPGLFSFANGTFISGATSPNSNVNTDSNGADAPTLLADTGANQLIALLAAAALAGFTSLIILKRIKN